MTSRELVYKTLEFQNFERAPRQLWTLPWAHFHYPEEVKKITEDFPPDIITSPEFYTKPLHTHGERYEIGEYVDEWNCRYVNIMRGVRGEVKEPLVKGENWEDSCNIRIPEEYLSIDKNKVNEFCKNTDKFVIAGEVVNIFERLQYIRTTEQLLLDMVLKPEGMFRTMRKIHDFYCEVLETWADTDVDALLIQDDWGAQKSLLINPKTWVEIFKPLYKEYIDIAHRHGKKVFMHSDGYILDIFPHLIEIGLDAINSQIFCMGVENLSQFRGMITFWGEIDRQYLLAFGKLEEIEEAVKKVKDNLWANGGCIAQCEFGVGAKPENVYKVFETWEKII